MAQGLRSSWSSWDRLPFFYAAFSTEGRERIPQAVLTRFTSMTKEEALKVIRENNAFTPLNASAVSVVIIHDTTITDLALIDQQWVGKTLPGGSGAYKNMPYHVIVDGAGVLNNGRSTDTQASLKDPAWMCLNNDLHICFTFNTGNIPEVETSADAAVLKVMYKIVAWKYEGGFNNIQFSSVSTHMHHADHSEANCGKMFGDCVLAAATRWSSLHNACHLHIDSNTNHSYEGTMEAMLRDVEMARGLTPTAPPSSPVDPNPSTPGHPTQ